MINSDVPFNYGIFTPTITTKNTGGWYYDATTGGANDPFPIYDYTKLSITPQVPNFREPEPEKPVGKFNISKRKLDLT